MTVIALAVILTILVMLARAPFWLAFVALLMAMAGVAYGSGGRTGFYEITEEGGLGEYRGRSRPDLGSMRGQKPTFRS